MSFSLYPHLTTIANMPVAGIIIFFLSSVHHKSNSDMKINENIRSICEISSLSSVELVLNKVSLRFSKTTELHLSLNRNITRL